PAGKTLTELCLRGFGRFQGRCSRQHAMTMLAPGVKSTDLGAPIKAADNVEAGEHKFDRCGESPSNNPREFWRVFCPLQPGIKHHTNSANQHAPRGGYSQPPTLKHHQAVNSHLL